MHKDSSELVLKVSKQYQLPQEFLQLMLTWDLQDLKAVQSMLALRRESCSNRLEGAVTQQDMFRFQGELASLRKLINDIECWFKAIQEDKK